MILMAEAKTSSKPSSDKLVPVLVLITIAMAFGLGVMWQKVNNMQSGSSTTTPTAVGNVGTDTTAAAPSVGIGFGKLTEEQAAAIIPVSDNDRVRGSSSTGVYIVEYSDLECPFCQTFHPTAQQAIDEYDGQVAWVYRHFPLDQLHPNARSAAEASECAAEIGGNNGFWSFVDAAFENQTALSNLSTIATAAGLNASAITSCVEAGTHKDGVESQYQGGIAAGITGTPGIFVVNSNGEAWFLPGAYPIEDLRNFIDEALQG